MKQKLYVGILFLEAFDQLGHPVAGDARDCAHADGSGFQSFDLLCFFEDCLIPVNGFLYKRVQLGSLNCQSDAMPRAGEQLHGELVFQGNDHLADGGLGKTEGVGGFCKASQFQDLFQCKISVHIIKSSFLIITLATFVLLII